MVIPVRHAARIAEMPPNARCRGGRRGGAVPTLGGVVFALRRWRRRLKVALKEKEKATQYVVFSASYFQPFLSNELIHDSYPMTHLVLNLVVVSDTALVGGNGG